MKKAYYLPNCKTCMRIINDLGLVNAGFVLQDIKTNPITADDLQAMFEHTHSYEALFSKVSRKYKALNLKDQNLQEGDFKKLLLEEYTFLKRPVIFFDDQLFIGNAKSNIDRLKAKLGISIEKI